MCSVQCVWCYLFFLSFVISCLCYLEKFLDALLILSHWHLIVFKKSFNWGKRVSYLFFACLTKAKPNLSLSKDFTKKYKLRKKSLKKRTHKQGMCCRVSWKFFALVKWRLSDKRDCPQIHFVFYSGLWLLSWKSPPHLRPNKLIWNTSGKVFFAQQRFNY